MTLSFTRKQRKTNQLNAKKHNLTIDYPCNLKVLGNRKKRQVSSLDIVQIQALWILLGQNTNFTEVEP